MTSDGCPCHKGGEAWEWMNFLTGPVSLFCHHLLPLPGGPVENEDRPGGLSCVGEAPRWRVRGGRGHVRH